MNRPSRNRTLRRIGSSGVMCAISTLQGCRPGPELTAVGAVTETSWTDISGSPSAWCGIDKAGRVRCHGAGYGPNSGLDPKFHWNSVDGTGLSTMESDGPELVAVTTIAIDPFAGFVHGWSFCNKPDVISGENTSWWFWHTDAIDVQAGGGGMVLHSNGSVTSLYGGCYPEEGGGHAFDDADFVRIEASLRGRCGIDADGDLHCEGGHEEARFSACGDGGPDDEYSCWKTEDLHRPGPWVDVTGGDQFTCALDPDGQTSCWAGTPGEDPDYLNPPTTRFVDIEAGAQHVCGLLDDGSVECWGNTDILADPMPLGPYEQITGYCGLDSDGLISCWGVEALATEPALSYR